MAGYLRIFLPCVASVIAGATKEMDSMQSCATGDVESLLQVSGGNARYKPPSSTLLGDSLPCKELEGVPIYILNLNRRADRLGNLNKLLNGTWLGQQACRVPAVDAHDFGSRLDSSLVREDLWSAVRQAPGKIVDEQGSGRLVETSVLQTPGSIALRMGHALMWEHALQQNASFAVLMEDNVNWLHPKFNEVMCDIARGQEPTNGWELIQLQTYSGQDAFATNQPEVLKSTDYDLGMYVISREAASKALRKAFPVDTHSLRLDVPQGILRGSLEGYRVHPPVANAPNSKYGTDVQDLKLMQPVNPIPDCQALDATAMLYPQLLPLQPTTAAPKGLQLFQTQSVMEFGMGLVAVISAGLVWIIYRENGTSIVLKILAYLALLTTIQFTVKYLMRDCGFEYPASITFLHFLLSFMFGGAFMAYRDTWNITPAVYPTCSEFSWVIVPIGIMHAASTTMTNASLMYCSIAVVQIIGSTTPVVAACLVLWTGMPFDRWMFLATLSVAAASILSVEGEAHFSTIGVCLAFGSNVARALKGTLQQQIMTGHNVREFDAVSLLTWMCLACSMVMLALSAVQEGSSPWKMLISPPRPVQLYSALLVSCLNAALLNLFNLFVTRDLGAVGLQLCGQIKNVLSFMASVVIMREIVTSVQWFGMCLVMVSVQWYQHSSKQLKESLAKQSSK
eukprot:TRINITY_DN7278_c0_g1_i1.p1 TRINITY_DN7278_c0_g1~~TRINITY_DN7278_c0_g1_i1.p1  ORF type:complete len:679 (+),score=92.26 TRINITY_DN7278_c0_g1_i1:118-2154(+)